MTTSDKMTTDELEKWFQGLSEYDTSDQCDLVILRADEKTKRAFLITLYNAPNMG